MKYLAYLLGVIGLLAVVIFILLPPDPHVSEIWMDEEHHGYLVEVVAEDGVVLTDICSNDMVFAAMEYFYEHFTLAEGELHCPILSPEVPELPELPGAAGGIPL